MAFLCLLCILETKPLFNFILLLIAKECGSEPQLNVPQRLTINLKWTFNNNLIFNAMTGIPAAKFGSIWQFWQDSRSLRICPGILRSVLNKSPANWNATILYTSQISPAKAPCGTRYFTHDTFLVCFVTRHFTSIYTDYQSFPVFLIRFSTFPSVSVTHFITPWKSTWILFEMSRHNDFHVWFHFYEAQNQTAEMCVICTRKVINVNFPTSIHLFPFQERTQSANVEFYSTILLWLLVGWSVTECFI